MEQARDRATTQFEIPRPDEELLVLEWRIAQLGSGEPQPTNGICRSCFDDRMIEAERGRRARSEC